MKLTSKTLQVFLPEGILADALASKAVENFKSALCMLRGSERALNTAGHEPQTL